MVELVKHCPTPQATEQLAKDIAPFLLAGDVIALTGYLGAGKSHFARALVIALGCKQKHLPSPTFNLLQVYDDTRLPVAHADFYRLQTPEEADDLALESFLEHGLTIIEWPENAKHIIPNTALWINIVDEGEGRKFTLNATDPSWGKKFGLFAPELRRKNSEKNRLAYLAEQTGRQGQVLTSVSGDASFRSYWRFSGADKPSILMDAPPPIEDIACFAEIDKYLEGIGLHAPHIYQLDTKKGYALIEDMGNTTFYTAIKEGADILTLYQKAVDVLAHVAVSPRATVPVYDINMYKDEASVFSDWYMPTANCHATHTADRRQYRDIMAGFYDTIKAVPTTTMFKDYHCQNLMLLSPIADVKCHADRAKNIADVGVLDFQDARIGPVTYDIASLLYDVRFDVPVEIHDILIKRLVDSFDGAVTMQAFMDSYRLIAIQNLLRIAGVFTRLAYRDGKTNYLDYMPRLWGHLDKLLAQTPQAKELAVFISKNTPAIREIAV